MEKDKLYVLFEHLGFVILEISSAPCFFGNMKQEVIFTIRYLLLANKVASETLVPVILVNHRASGHLLTGFYLRVWVLEILTSFKEQYSYSNRKCWGCYGSK